MATEAGIHPVTMPPALPVEDVPPDESLPADSLAVAVEDDAGEAAKGGDDEEKVVTEVSLTKVTVVEEVVTTVEEIVTETGEVVGRTVDEVVTVNETVEQSEVMETDGEKADKKRLREGEESAEAETGQEAAEGAAVKRVKSDAGEADASDEMDEDQKAEAEGDKDDANKVVEPVKLGPKVFNNPIKMFTYFYDFLHTWNLNQNVNKYEFLVLSELVSQGNPQKVGEGIAAFQVRTHPQYSSRCYYLIRKDGSEDDFSYRKCVDKLMPLPPSLFRSNGELDIEKIFPNQKGRHYGHQNGGREGGKGGGGGRGFHGGRGGRGRGGRGGGGRRGGRGRL